MRRLEILIPIVLLAVLVQLFAPIAAFRAFAYATNDPLYMATICSDMSSSPDAHANPAKRQHQHDECCAFCAAGHAGSLAIDAPVQIFVVLHRQYQRVSWLEAAYPEPTVRAGSNTQARAPPVLT